MVQNPPVLDGVQRWNHGLLPTWDSTSADPVPPFMDIPAVRAHPKKHWAQISICFLATLKLISVFLPFSLSLTLIFRFIFIIFPFPSCASASITAAGLLLVAAVTVLFL